MSIDTKIVDMKEAVEYVKTPVCEYNYINLSRLPNEINRTKIYAAEVINNLRELRDIDVSQNIGDEYYDPCNELAIFEDLLLLTREGQVTNVIHLDLKYLQKYILIVKIFDQFLIWRIQGKIRGDRYAS